MLHSCRDGFNLNYKHYLPTTASNNSYISLRQQRVIWENVSNTFQIQSSELLKYLHLLLD